MERYRLALDTGGTFTDVVAFDEHTGAIHTTKTPSTVAVYLVAADRSVRRF